MQEAAKHSLHTPRQEDHNEKQEVFETTELQVDIVLDAPAAPQEVSQETQRAVPGGTTEDHYKKFGCSRCRMKPGCTPSCWKGRAVREAKRRKTAVVKVQSSGQNTSTSITETDSAVSVRDESAVLGPDTTSNKRAKTCRQVDPPVAAAHRGRGVAGI